MFLIDWEYPPPHFHVTYGEHMAVTALHQLNLIEGDFSKRSWQMVREWAGVHQDELLEMWTTRRFGGVVPLK